MKPNRLPRLMIVGSVASGGLLWWHGAALTERDSALGTLPIVLRRSVNNPLGKHQIAPSKNAEASSVELQPPALNIAKNHLSEIAAHATTIPGKTATGRPRPIRLAPTPLPAPPRLQSFARARTSSLAGAREASNPDSEIPVGLALDVSLGAVLPAVVAAAGESDSISPNETAVAAAKAILDNFVAAVSPEISGPPSTVTSDGLPSEAESWQTSVSLADAQYRALFGKQAFLNQSMQAARVLREASVSP